MEIKRINLALQGGGAHGAYTWGVLDRLLDEDRLEVEAISGTSAGAMNAAVFADGMGRGGREEARRALDNFWTNISRAAQAGPLQPTPFDRYSSGWNLDHSAAFVAFDMLTRMLSPYQLNPMNLNPLRGVLERSVDFRRLEGCRAVKLFLSATNVKTGKVRVFQSGEITADVLLASACLPFLFQAVTVDGDPYWDGGYMGNPAIFPLIYGTQSQDVVIVQINPLCCDRVPTTAAEIMNRVNEISFNSSLMREMRAISFVTDLIDEQKLDSNSYKRINVHWIEAEKQMRGLGVSSKLNARMDFLLHLKAIGRKAADDWLAGHFDHIGRRSTIDIREKFL
ncbi:MAG: patatin-like phospholipase family protein [Reyranella sp.]|uniref:patatin-like phospholipase family protein n=1 Tax=Reyranella sp. TaxID=1929291 RepID=UPI00122A905C|nr:patatin-like phospholipase family protein [Reyranella sp.]TAJ96894.1 MAG: patatin-like phospholipase family protein [Reyranella sp.]